MILHGKTEAFAQIILRTEGLVAQILSRMIVVQEDRKDLAQDIYMKAFHKLQDFKFQAKLSTWIGQIAFNTCLNWLEKKKTAFGLRFFKTRRVARPDSRQAGTRWELCL